MANYQATYFQSRYLSELLKFSILHPLYVELYSITVDQDIYCASANINITTYEKENIFNPE